MKKFPKIIELAIFVISIIIMVVFYLNMSTIAVGSKSPIMDISLFWSYFLVAVAILLALVFPLIDAFKSPKALRNLLLGLVAVVVIVGACYLLAPGGEVKTTAAYTPQTSKLVDAGLYLTYFMLFVTFASLIYAIVRGAINNK
jgi:TRAP-type C4-dicarboxylate transport system permease small subunit